MAAFWAWFGVSWRAFWGVLQGFSSSNPPLLDPIAAWAWVELFQDLFGISEGLFWAASPGIWWCWRCQIPGDPTFPEIPNFGDFRLPSGDSQIPEDSAPSAAQGPQSLSLGVNPSNPTAPKLQLHLH